MELTFKPGKPQDLWSDGLQRLYMLWGAEERWKDIAITVLSDRAVPPDWRDFDYEVLHLSECDSNTIIRAAGQVPFGAEKRMVLVKGAEKWRERSYASDAESFAEKVASIPDTACVVLVAAALDDDSRRKTIISPKFDAAIKKVGATVACGQLQGDALIRWIVEECAQAEKVMPVESAALLVETAGSSLVRLGQEIQKLVAYVGNRPNISQQDIQTLVSELPEDTLFQTVDAVMRGDTDNALLLLSELHRHDPRPQAVAGKFLAILSRQIKLVWQARWLIDQRIPPGGVRNLSPELAAALPVETCITQVAFKAGALFGMAKQWNFGRLTRAQELLLQCDMANKGGADDEEAVFGQDVVTNIQLLVILLTTNA